MIYYSHQCSLLQLLLWLLKIILHLLHHYYWIIQEQKKDKNKQDDSHLPLTHRHTHRSAATSFTRLVLGAINLLFVLLWVLGQPWQSSMPKWPFSQLQSKQTVHQPSAGCEMPGPGCLAPFIILPPKALISLPGKTVRWQHSSQHICKLREWEI